MRLHVAADDRTGALEVAAALADHGAGGDHGIPVTVWPSESTAAITVTDIGSRHLDPFVAAQRAGAIVTTGPIAHKIDSTLRGNWAVELAARHAVAGRPVLVVAALPALGRVCSGGIVFDHGHPVHEGAAGTDVRQGVTMSRPTEHLHAAGAHEVVELATTAEVVEWLDEPTGYAVADALDDGDVADLAAAWNAAPGVLLAGTSAVIGATAGSSATSMHPTLNGPILVVNGSVHPVARAQIDALAAHGAVLVEDGDIGIAVQALRAQRHAIVTGGMPADAISATDAVELAALLAGRAHAVADAVHDLAAIVVLGGDTAAAVLGDGDVTVFGSVHPGTAWVESPRFLAPVITRAGGFGEADDLVALLWDALQR